MCVTFATKASLDRKSPSFLLSQTHELRELPVIEKLAGPKRTQLFLMGRYITDLN